MLQADSPADSTAPSGVSSDQFHRRFRELCPQGSRETTGDVKTTQPKSSLRTCHTVPRNPACRGVHIHTPVLTFPNSRSAVQAALLLALAAGSEVK
ncbi:hypothetical protein [Kitasatospora phosalacinea]|uniref:Uncharacterized protein n=1 Tax=Kitasatospora phosalacinea TaxID=2065 RepID=A0A9W6PN51_9ACTN|nr:hypothetical protein [Kitasatospora phosalacinea]GLW58086.1 hypothetical protein Kpho01_60970 [Kitasatospora phosalacinea]